MQKLSRVLLRDQQHLVEAAPTRAPTALSLLRQRSRPCDYFASHQHPKTNNEQNPCILDCVIVLVAGGREGSLNLQRRKWILLSIRPQEAESQSVCEIGRKLIESRW